MGSTESKVCQIPVESKQTTPVKVNKTQRAWTTDENTDTTRQGNSETNPNDKPSNEKIEYPLTNDIIQTVELKSLPTEDGDMSYDYIDTDRTASVMDTDRPASINGSKKKKHKSKKKKKKFSEKKSENQNELPGAVNNDADHLSRTKDLEGHTSLENSIDNHENTQGSLSVLFKQRTYSYEKQESNPAEEPITHDKESEERNVLLTRGCGSESDDIHDDKEGKEYTRELQEEDGTESGTKLAMLTDTQKEEKQKKKKKKKKKHSLVDKLTHSNKSQTSDSGSSPRFTSRSTSTVANGDTSTVHMDNIGPEKQRTGYNVHYERQIAELRNENNELKNRISKMISDLVTDNNPNIADISDPNRPLKLGDRFWELYNNEWTDALISLNTMNIEDNEGIGILLAIIVSIYAECRRIVTADMEALETAILKVTRCSEMTNELKLSLKLYKDHRKKNYLDSITPADEFVQRLLPSGIVMTDSLDIYIRLGYELCWLMLIQDPPVHLVHQVDEGAPFNKQYFKEYTKSGPYCDYVVWPMLCLYENGPVLQKGVMQGKSGGKQ